MKILQLTHLCYVGQTLANALKKLGHDAVFSPTPDGIDFREFDIIHAHYALTGSTIKGFLRAKKEGKPLVLHLHGSDVRRITPNGVKRLPPHLDKISSFLRKNSDMVLLAVPDIAEYATGIYVPNPVDLEKFRPMPEVQKINRTLILGHQISWKLLEPFIDQSKEYDFINYGIEFEIPTNLRSLPKIPHDELPAFLNKYEFMIGSIGVPFSLARLEAMACGLKTFTNFPSKYEVYYNFENPDKVDDPRDFILRWHEPVKIASWLAKLYQEILNKKCC